MAGAASTAGSPSRTDSGNRVRRIAAYVLVAALTLALAARLPVAFRQFNDKASTNAGRDSTGRLLVAADSIDVDNDFVLAAPQHVPLDASYALLLPPSEQVAAESYGIGALTLSALPGYMRFVMLPRREAAPEDAQYVLCYACDTAPWDHRTSWLWKNDHAVVIGKVNRP